MTSRRPEDVINFAPGPAKLPKDVIYKAQTAALNWENTGVGVMELSHRSKEFGLILRESIDSLRQILQVPDNYKVLLLQGGGTAQFAAIPLNITRSCDEVADYFVTGQWSSKAAKEAAKYLKVNYVLPKLDSYTHIPDSSSWRLSPNASYVYYCDNETVHGVEFQGIPQVGDDKILVCDMSSNFLTRPVDISKFGIIYAGAQKNVGCAGISIVIIREDLIGNPRKECPSFIDYTLQASMNSLYNTPSTWAIYILGQVLRWVQEQGGISAMQANSATKSQLVYDVITASNGYYIPLVDPLYRSRINIPFRIGAKENRDGIEQEFLKQAEFSGLLQLKGHRSIGGLRASLYNAITIEEVEQLVKFMTKFMKEN